jgi:amino acid adenylation domain-containing protein
VNGQDRLAGLGNLPPAPDLPRSASALPAPPRFHRRQRHLPAPRWQALKALARGRGLSPSSLLLAAYAEVLARWSSTRRFTLNLTSSDRAAQPRAMHQVLGDFTAVLLHAVDRGDPTMAFADVAEQMRRQLLEELDHAAFSGIEVLREWTRHHGAAPGAAMPVVFTSLLSSRDEWRLDGFGTHVHGISQTSQVLVDHQVGEVDGDLAIVWDTVDAAFPDGLLDAMVGCHAALLDRLLDDAQAWTATDLAALPADMQQRREAAGLTTLALPRQHLHQGIVAQALADPLAPALITPARQLTRGQLLAAASARADTLLGHGLHPGEPVAVLMHKGWEQVVAVLGTLLAGGAFVPVDADLPPRRQDELQRLCQARHVLVQPDTEPAPPRGPWAPHAIRAGIDNPESARPLPDIHGSVDRTAYIMFTSGTTGTPKGVMTSHRGAVNTVLAVNRLFGVGPGDTVLGVSALSFDLSIYDVFGVLGAGGRLVLPDARLKHDPLHWHALLARHGATLWNSAPQLLAMLLDALPAEGPLPGRLRTVLLSGDFIPLDTLQRLRRHGCSAELVSLGGATEASIWSVFHRVQQVNPAWRSIPYGRPLPNQTMQVLDAALRPTPDHVRGRIYIGGAGLAQGYLREPVLTAERFFHHPATGQRLYDTGDLGLYAADGSIVILGRDDRQVKIRGHRVELGEVEAVLARHPDVAQAVVTAPAAPGGGPRRLVAHLQPRPGCVLQEAALRQHAATHLPEHMVPLHIVVLERLPLSANGKLDLRALPDPAEGITDTPPRQPARNDTERTLLAIWQRAMPGIEIGVTDSFFELGGDSVLAAHLLRELNAELPVKLQMHELFEHMSIEALALWADAQAAQPA